MDYGLSKRMSKDDTRQKIWKKQRKKRGFDDTETWSLYTVISKFCIPRLKRFKKLNNGYPLGLSENEWDNVLDEMIEGFKLSLNDIPTEEEVNKINKALELFSKYYMDLWW